MAGELGGELGATAESEFAIHVREVGLDGPPRDVETSADLRVRQALGRKFADSLLHVGEGVPSRCRPCRAQVDRSGVERLEGAGDTCAVVFRSEFACHCRGLAKECNSLFAVAVGCQKVRGVFARLGEQRQELGATE